MTPLTADKLRKSPTYAEEFAGRLKGKKPFDIVKNSAVVAKAVLLDTPGLERVILHGTILQLKELKFTDGKGHMYTLNQIGRDTGFGGSDIKTVMGQEDSDIKRLKIRLAKMKAQVDNDTNTIHLKLKSGDIDVYALTSSPKIRGVAPKGDVTFLNAKRKPVAWISLKKAGKSASDFNQWSGISSQSGSRISTHPEVVQFVKDIIALYPDKVIPNATNIQRKIKDRTLKMAAVYGSDFGGSRGLNNVNLVVRGVPEFVQMGNEVAIIGMKVFQNGDEVKDDYEPVLTAAFKGDRSEFGIRGARFSISPAGGRSHPILI